MSDIAALAKLAAGTSLLIFSTSTFAQSSDPSTYRITEAAEFYALADRILSPDWTPTIRMTTADKPPKECKGVAAEIDMTIAPVNGLGQYLSVEFLTAGNIWAGQFTPVRYRGESFNCLPAGKGVITYQDGGLWIGEVSNPTNIRDKTVKWAPDRRPMRVGQGIERSGSQQPGRTLFSKWDVAVIVGRYDGQARRREVLNSVIAFQEKPNYPIIRPADRNFDYSANSGRARLTFSDGAFMSLNFTSGKASLEKEVSYFFPNIDSVRGIVKSYNAKGVTFSSVSSLTVSDKNSDLPTGRYRFYRTPAEREIAARDIKAGTKTLEYNPADLFKPERRLYLEPLENGLPEMLKRPGGNLWKCTPVNPLPEGWVIWWQTCAGPNDQNQMQQSTSAYSPDGKQRIDQFFGTDPHVIYTDDLVNLKARAIALSPTISVVDPVDANIMTELGIDRYRGPFTSLRPDGQGFCYDKSLKDYTEPCTFRYGKRVDEIHLARLEEKRAKEELARLAKAQAEETRLANARAEDERRAADQRFAEEERLRRQAALDAENEEDEDSSSGAYFADMLNDLRGKAQQSAQEMDAVRRQVAAENAAQQRAADARAAANAAQQRQAAAQRQASVDAANAASAERARIAREDAAARQRAAEQRLADAQAAAARARAAAQSPVPSASYGAGNLQSPAKSAPTQPSILTFRSAAGWYVGQVSQTLAAQGLSVQIKVNPSTIAGKHYYRAEFCSTNGAAWNGGMRLTDNYPERTHATIRVPAGGCTSWSDHLSATTAEIYVLVQQDRGQ